MCKWISRVKNEPNLQFVCTEEVCFYYGDALCIKEHRTMHHQSICLVDFLSHMIIIIILKPTYLPKFSEVLPMQQNLIGMA